MWKCACGAGVKVVSETEGDASAAALTVNCPGCGRQRTIHTARIILVATYDAAMFGRVVRQPHRIGRDLIMRYGGNPVAHKEQHPMTDNWMDGIISEHHKQSEAEQIRLQAQMQARRRFEAAIGPFWLRIKDELANTVTIFNEKNKSTVLWIEPKSEELLQIRDKSGASVTIALNEQLEHIEAVYVPSLALPNGQSVARKEFAIAETYGSLTLRRNKQSGPDEPLESAIQEILRDFARVAIRK